MAMLAFVLTGYIIANVANRTFLFPFCFRTATVELFPVKKRGVSTGRGRELRRPYSLGSMSMANHDSGKKREQHRAKPTGFEYPRLTACCIVPADERQDGNCNLADSDGHGRLIRGLKVRSSPLPVR
jgi:hypothetical protein